MSFKPSRFDHDYSLAVLGQLTVTERVTHDADVARLNEVAGAWAYCVFMVLLPVGVIVQYQ